MASVGLSALCATDSNVDSASDAPDEALPGVSPNSTVVGREAGGDTAWPDGKPGSNGPGIGRRREYQAYMGVPSMYGGGSCSWWTGEREATGGRFLCFLRARCIGPEKNLVDNPPMWPTASGKEWPGKPNM